MENNTINDTERCFICLDSNNLKYAEICCGKTYFHEKCLETYCKKNGPVCNICKSDISDKFKLTTKTVTVYVVDWWKIFTRTSVVLYGIIVICGIVITILLGKPNNHYLVLPFVIVYVTIPLLGVTLTGMVDGMNISDYYKNLIQLVIISIPTIINHSVLFVTSIVSYLHPSILSTDTVFIIFICIGCIDVVIGICALIEMFIKLIIDCMRSFCSLETFINTTSTNTKEYKINHDFVNSV